ncbi:MAG: class I SAM-dependent methyltransferase [Solirubrobacteraceae bacterium]
MKLDSFWPPRHSYDRALAEWYRRRHTDEPWLTRSSIKLLEDLLRNGDRVIEWGSGTSTAWVGARVSRLLSVEHDPAWFERVSGELRAAGVSGAEIRLLGIEPAHDHDATPYVGVVDEFEDGSLDVAFIDGEYRSACALRVLPKLASGGVVVLDDAHNFLDHPSQSPHSRGGRGSLDSGWERFAGAVSSWRVIWTSDGFSDTALYFKP